MDTITFDPELWAAGAGEILLKYGEMAITEAVVIDGPGADLLTVDAQQQSRIFNITATSGDFTIEGLTVAHGRTTGNNVTGPNPYDYSGGAIRSVSLGTLTLEGVHVVDSGTTGTGASGGGVFSQGPLVLYGSVVSGNSTAGNNAYGGGVATRSSFSAVDSIIDGNRVFGLDMSGGGVWSQTTAMLAHSSVTNNALMNGSPIYGGGPPIGGGGVFAGGVTVTDSSVSGNTTSGTLGGAGICAVSLVTITRRNVSDNHAGRHEGGGGGGVFTWGQVNVVGSTIAGNSATGAGGGISGGSVTLTNSTVSGNTVNAVEMSVVHVGGGGIAARGVTILFSTITENHAVGPDADGGGVSVTSSFVGRGSIIIGNSAASQGDDLFGTGNLQFSLLGNNEGTPAGNLVEAPVGSPDATGNLIGGPVNGVIDPKLGPLVYNGGPVFLDGLRMLTHALLPGSPAIDAGDPAAVAGVGNVPEFDQRGLPFGRVVNGDDVPEARIDMGAVEWQVNPLPGDYNFDGLVNAADYSVWRNTLGSTNDLRADGTSASTPGAPDGVVDELDYAFWKANFGNVLQQGSGSGEQGVVQLAGELRLAGSAGATETTESRGDTVASPARRSSPAIGAEDFAFTSFKLGRQTDSPRHDAAIVRGRTTHDDALVAWLARRSEQHAPDDSGDDFEHAEVTVTESAVGTRDEAFAVFSGGF